jgi:hypothetical protein
MTNPATSAFRRSHCAGRNSAIADRNDLIASVRRPWLSALGADGSVPDARINSKVIRASQLASSAAA